MGGGASEGSSYGYSIGDSSTRQSRNFNLGGNLQSLFNQNIQNPGLDPAAKPRMVSMMNNECEIPGNCALKDAAQQNLFSNNYADNSTALFEERVGRGLNMAKSSPESVIAPLNRGSAFREAEVINQMARERGQELRENRVADAQISMGAADQLHKESFNAADMLRQFQASQNASLAGATGPLSTENTVVNESHNNRGDTQNNSSGFGFSICCFIFMEYFNGKLPDYVRHCRDRWVTNRRRIGYNALARWLVPVMRVSGCGRALVNVGLVWPCLIYGSYHENAEIGFGCRKWGFLAKPVVWAWFYTFSAIGFAIEQTEKLNNSELKGAQNGR